MNNEEYLRKLNGQSNMGLIIEEVSSDIHL